MDVRLVRPIEPITRQDGTAHIQAVIDKQHGTVKDGEGNPSVEAADEYNGQNAGGGTESESGEDESSESVWLDSESPSESGGEEKQAQSGEHHVLDVRV